MTDALYEGSAQLPAKDEIVSRLSQIDMGRLEAAHETGLLQPLFAAVARNEGKELNSRGVVQMLVLAISEAATKYDIGVEHALFVSIPKMIEVLFDDDDFVRETLQAFEDLKSHLRNQDPEG